MNGNISISGSAYILIAPGGSLKLYGGGTKSTLSGGGIANGTGLAANFSYFGMTNNTDVSYSGNSALVGTVYAPQADFSISGGADFYGAAIVNSFSMSGGGAVHYDEALGAPAALVLGSYREL